MNSKNREEWDLNHPDDEMPMRLGIDGQYIPERYIPFNSSDLQDHDVIVNEDNQYIIYHKEDKSYQLYNSSPNKFLANPFKEWKKFPVSSEKIRTDQITYNICMDRLERLLSNNIKLGYSEHNTSIQGDNIIPFTLHSNYFTPSIEDIHIGYECEKRILDFSVYRNFPSPEVYEQWLLGKEAEFEPFKVDGATIKFVETSGRNNTDKGNCVGILRVPYLTKEQIEKEGWKILEIPKRWILHGKTMELSYNLENKKLTPLPAGSQNVQLGQMNVSLDCKDINTFRKICKLIGI